MIIVKVSINTNHLTCLGWFTFFQRKIEIKMADIEAENIPNSNMPLNSCANKPKKANARSAALKL
ncbi:MAG: hypothetical protein EOO07_35615 [Chitinophagaceae bacterium]|nr:MAG: hypothetical protein EOO07_35615 [Chitinophagaceae bacterium]